MKVLFYVFLTILLVGCKKPLLTPEDEDPIYKELMNDFSNSTKAVEEQKKKIEEFSVQLENIIPQTGQTRKLYGQYFDMKNELSRLEQKALYSELAAKSRKYEARNAYLRAFEAEQPWPNPSEYEEFKLNRQLQKVDKDWRKRYPAAENKSAKKPAAKNEHGEESGEH